MRLSARGRDLGLALLLLGTPTVFLALGPERPLRANWLDRAVLHILTLPGAGLAASAEKGVEAWRGYVSLVGVRAEAERLRHQNRKLQRRLQVARRGLDELASCRALLHFSAEHQLEAVGARVIGRSTSPFVRALRLRLDQGTGSIRSGQAVVAADGVVGRVGRVYGGYADLLLAADPAQAIDVVVSRSSTRALVSGLQGADSYRLRLAYVLRDEQIRPGDRVVTSGAGGVFPAGLLVGTVSEVQTRRVGLYQEVTVEPAVDFASLREVLVLVRSAAPKARPSSDQRSSSSLTEARAS
jgi:rod shape-determining protein MreC